LNFGDCFAYAFAKETRMFIVGITTTMMIHTRLVPVLMFR
jgi:uncharacterized protein with PIN domain